MISAFDTKLAKIFETRQEISKLKPGRNFSKVFPVPKSGETMTVEAESTGSLELFRYALRLNS